MEAVIKSAASAVSRKTKSSGPRSREEPGRGLGKRTAAGRGASLDLGPLDLVFLEAALAADLITASKSPNDQKGFATFRTLEKRQWNNSADTHPTKIMGKSTSRPGEAFGKSPGTPKRRTKDIN